MKTDLVSFISGLKRLLNRFLSKALDYHVSEANKTNDACNNRPISKNHTHLLKSLRLILNPPSSLGQYHSHGFSLIEVMITASLIGFFAVLGMNMRDTMQRSQDILEGKFSSFQLMQEIENIISSNNSCFETFKEVDLTDFELEKEGFVKGIPINGLKQVIQSADPDESPFIKEVFLTDKKLDHTGTQISKFSLKKDSLSFIKEGFSNVTLTFMVTFKYDVRDSPNYSKATRINFTVDPKTFEIQGCLGSNSIGGGTISLVDSTEDKSMDGLTGTEACELKNKKCSHVLSQNFASMVYGQDSLANLCQINYNSKANDIKTGTMLSNLHSCEAKVGTFETYTLKQKTSGVTCKGIFRAICN